MTLRIINLKAENYKRLVAVDITPEGNVVVVSGRNGQGKTSVLDAIFAALGGGAASRSTSQPIRDGQDQAYVKLDLGDYIVTRRWTKDDAGTLTIESPNRARFQSPQKLLDSIVGRLALDPLEFLRMSAAEQVNALVDSLGDSLGFDPVELEKERKAIFDSRTEVGREVSRIEKHLTSLPEYDDVPEEEVSTAALVEELREADRINLERRAAEQRLDLANAEVERIREALRVAEEDVADAENHLRGCPDPVDVNAINDRLTHLDETNARIRAAAERRKVAAELAKVKERHAKLTIALEQIREKKEKGIAAAKFPMPGLSFDESGVTLNGIPFQQASGAERLRASAAIAMAAHPELRVLRIDGGEALDSDGLKLLEEMAAEHDYQVWISRVDESGSVGIVIEDGAVA